MAWQAGKSLNEASLVAGTDITKHFISQSSLRGALTNLLNAVCDLLVPSFLRAFIGDTIETDQKFVHKLRSFPIGKGQGVLRQLVNGGCHRIIFASGSYGSSDDPRSTTTATTDLISIRKARNREKFVSARAPKPAREGACVPQNI